MLVKDYILLHHGADDSLINIISKLPIDYRSRLWPNSFRQHDTATTG
ncbi:hypothetical protein sh3_0001 [Citrobacter phage SH3]|uniref:Uncharacterized protein n=1 Tax=Citrobacter phage SH3 TaxID=1805466 RepID=A0A172JG98_9CAUD|nr:hypothetical protein BI009_gp01 [Citrobacter phage SH3]AMR59532.1 hypothetical protein sh3_0001 [Citrobacter phage SH3]